MLAALSAVEATVKNAIAEHHARELEVKGHATMSAKEKMIIERRQEVFVKNIVAEFQDTYSKLRHFFTVKLEKNWKRINEKLQS